MKKHVQIARLQEISNLILDRRLATLRYLAAKRNASLQHLQDLTPKEAGTLDPIPQARSALRYEAWADVRRSEINLALARQTADWLDAKKNAEVAFGQVEVLNRIQTKILK